LSVSSWNCKEAGQEADAAAHLLAKSVKSESLACFAFNCVCIELVTHFTYDSSVKDGYVDVDALHNVLPVPVKIAIVSCVAHEKLCDQYHSTFAVSPTHKTPMSVPLVDSISTHADVVALRVGAKIICTHKFKSVVAPVYGTNQDKS